MKLSEAIRLGAMLKPQGREALHHGGRTCALGAALDAIGALGDERFEMSFDAFKQQWPVMIGEFMCPLGCLGKRSSMGGAIIHLNDYHGWSRERIADWVASQEAVAEPVTEAAVVEIQS